MQVSYLNSLGTSQIGGHQGGKAVSDNQGKHVDTIGTASTIGKEPGDNIAEIQTNITSKIKPGDAIETDGNLQAQTINDGTEG